MKFAGIYLLPILITQLHFVWGDVEESVYVRQTPHQMTVLRAEGENPESLGVIGFFSYSNSCEKDGYYNYQLHDREIVIDSYKEVRQNSFCLQTYREDVPVEFEISNLESGKTYQVYFLNEKGEAQFAGVLSVDPTIQTKNFLY
jgi:hypothetical protein